MEQHIRDDSALITTQATHDVAITVSGRDIVLTGLADSEAEATALVAAANQVPGRRAVRSDLTVLPVASPYITTITKAADGTYTANGAIPTEALRAILLRTTGSLSTLTLASGAPDGYTTALTDGLAALASLEQGALSISDTTVSFAGMAPDPDTLASVKTALSGIAGFATDEALTFTPKTVATDLTVRFDRTRGLFVNGTSPATLGAADVATRLSTTAVQGDFDASGTEPSTKIEVGLDALSPFLPEFEEVTLTANKDKIDVTGAVLTESDLDQIKDRLVASAAFDTVTITKSTSRFQNGDQRPNPLTGVTETYRDGFWVPEVKIQTANAQACGDLTRAAIADGSIRFVTASADLDAISRGTIAQLSAIVNSCFDQNPKLSILIEGHTDPVGSSVANLRLSAARAAAVRQALVDRGANMTRLRTQGLGEEYPISDNSTEEGRAQNRRTVVVWSE